MAGRDPLAYWDDDRSRLSSRFLFPISARDPSSAPDLRIGCGLGYRLGMGAKPCRYQPPAKRCRSAASRCHSKLGSGGVGAAGGHRRLGAGATTGRERHPGHEPGLDHEAADQLCRAGIAGSDLQLENPGLCRRHAARRCAARQSGHQGRRRSQAQHGAAVADAACSAGAWRARDPW